MHYLCPISPVIIVIIVVFGLVSNTVFISVFLVFPFLVFIISIFKYLIEV